jgi:hypothetical protein
MEVVKIILGPKADSKILKLVSAVTIACRVSDISGNFDFKFEGKTYS